MSDIVKAYKKEWIKSKLKDGHIFIKLNARGKIFIGSIVGTFLTQKRR